MLLKLDSREKFEFRLVRIRRPQSTIRLGDVGAQAVGVPKIKFIQSIDVSLGTFHVLRILSAMNYERLTPCRKAQVVVSDLCAPRRKVRRNLRC
jgi:hypothetical protein